MSSIVVFGVLLALTIGLTIYFYPKGYGALTGRSRLFRAAGMGLLCLLLALAMIFVGREFVGRVGALQKLALLISIYGIGISMICLALLDALESFVAMRKAQRQVVQQAIQTVIEEAQKQKQAQ